VRFYQNILILFVPQLQAQYVRHKVFNTNLIRCFCYTQLWRKIQPHWRVLVFIINYYLLRILYIHTMLKN